MTATRIAVGALLVLASATAAHVQQPAPARPPAAEHYSPLGFDDLRAYQQAFPGRPDSLDVARAAASKYWVFRGVAYRGSQPQGRAWTSLGPIEHDGRRRQRFGQLLGPRRGARHLAVLRARRTVSPLGRHGGRRRLAHRRRDAPGGRRVALDRSGARHQQHRQPRARSERRQRRHNLCRHGGNELTAELGRRHWPLSIDRRRRSLVARLDQHPRSRRVAVADRLHVDARHCERRRGAGQSTRPVRRHHHRDARHDRRARRAESDDGVRAAACRALQDG